MHKFGFANQPESDSRNDGLELRDSTVTNICRCAPPDNKPNREELTNCQPYFATTLELCDPIVILALGGLAWNATIPLIVEGGWLDQPKARPKFSHGGSIRLKDGRLLLGSYHPSQQNTFTGRLTETMFDSVFSKAKKRIEQFRREL